jgi:diguanylate cyclase (GGDEF)-like protein
MEESILLFGVPLLCIGLTLIFFVNLKRVKQVSQLSSRQRWLTRVYEDISGGVFVCQKDSIIYSNTLFKSLQLLYENENPFEHCTKDQQLIWLTTASLESHAYWVTRSELEDDSGAVFMINDITDVNMYESFIKKISADLAGPGQPAIHSLLNSLSSLLPTSLLYVSSYKQQDDLFQCVSQVGDDYGINLYEPVSMESTNIKSNSWTWLSRQDMKVNGVNSFINEYDPTHLAYVILSDYRKNIIGSIFILIKDTCVIDNQIIDAAVMTSLLIKSELEYLGNQKILLETNNRHQKFIEKSNDAIIDIELYPGVSTQLDSNDQLSVFKVNSVIKYMNNEFNRLFEISSEDDFNDIFSIKSLNNILNYVISSGYSSEKIEVLHETSYGEIKWIVCRCITDIEAGTLNKLWIVIQDITDAKFHLQKLEHQATHDALTGLPNRNALLGMLDFDIDQSEQFGFKVGLLIIDLDRFKEINDALGHHYGDVLLKKIEPILAPVLAPYRAKLSRIGGDEFAIVMASIKTTEEARQLASKVLSTIKQPFDLGQLNVEISGSIGISIFPDDGSDGSTLLRCADVAMHKAKSSPGGVLNYRDDIDGCSPRRLTIAASIASGLKNGDFHLCFQPKVHIEKNSIESCEALIRWEHSQLGTLRPAEFIPLAEMNDSIILITEWVIDRALLQIKRWNNIGLQIKVSVNVSTRNLLDENLVILLTNKLIEYQVPAHLLEIEITESALMADPDKALETLNKISALGISIAVDDFGTGYSSMIYLRQLPLDTLKVDLTFVSNMCHSEQDKIIVQSIIQLAHNLSLTVVAEGAEDIETVNALKHFECDEIQGYYFSKPLLPDEFIEFCKNWI